MLTAIRNVVTGWFAVVLVGLLIIPFALWGINFYFTAPTDVSIVRVAGNALKLQDYQLALYNFRQQMLRLFGGKLSPAQEMMVKEQTMEKMIGSELIDQFAESSNLRVSAASLSSKIRSIEAFQDQDANFDQDLYERILFNQGIDPAYFEDRLRLDTLSEQLQSTVTESMFVLDWEVDRIVNLKGQRRDFIYKIFSVDSYLDQIEVSSDDVADHYESNERLYHSPEQIKIAYIDLDVEQLMMEILFEEADLQDYYLSNKEQFEEPEKRGAERLVVSLGAPEDQVTDEEGEQEDVTTPTAEEILVRAQELLEEASKLVMGGNTFEEVVTLLDEQGKSGLDFIENNSVSRGELSAQVDEFLFSGASGDVSEAIKTDNSLELVKIGELKGGADNNTYENSREKVEEEYRRAEAETLFFEYTDLVIDLSYENPDDLETAAEAVNISIQESDFFTKDVAEKEGILSHRKIVDMSFSEEVKESGLNSVPIELSDTHTVVLRMIDSNPEQLQPFDEVMEEVEKDVKDVMVRKKVLDLSRDVLEKLEAGEEASALASQYEFEWSEAVDVKRDADSVNRAVLRSAFQIEKPQEDGNPVYHADDIGASDRVVVVLSEVRDGDLEEGYEELRKQVVESLEKRYLDSEWQQFFADLRSSADVQIIRPLEDL